MRRPRAFTCSRLGAEPPPPPTRKPLGYSSFSSPCRCGTCDKAPLQQSPSSATPAAVPETLKPPRKDSLVSSAPPAEKPRFRRLPRGSLASPSTAATAAAVREGPAAPNHEGEQRKPKRGSDRGDSSSGGSGRADAAIAPNLFLASTERVTAACVSSCASSSARPFGARAAATAAAAAAAAATTPAAVGIDASATEGESGSAAAAAATAAAAAAAASLLFKAGSFNEANASSSVTLIHFGHQGGPSLSSLDFVTDGSGTSTVSSSSSSSSSSGAGGMGVGLDRWKAPPTTASGIFSIGASSSSSQAAAAAVGRRRRRVGG